MQCRCSNFLKYLNPWLHYICHYYRICYTDSVCHLNAMLTSQVTWHTAKKSTTNKLHTSRINLSLQYTRGPVISTACIQQQLHSLFPLENKQTGIHSRAMNNRTSKWSSCQRTYTASAAMPNERRDAQAGSFRKLCLTPNKTSKVTFVQFTYIVPTWSY